MTTVESTSRSDDYRVRNRNPFYGKCAYYLNGAFADPAPVLLQALPGTGKSYGGIEWAARTANSLTIFAPRHELLEEDYRQWCTEHGLMYWKVPSFPRDCDGVTFEDGEPVDEVSARVKTMFDRGLSSERIHEQLDDELDCGGPEACACLQREPPAGQDVDVILATHEHAYNEALFEDRYVAVDEFPQDSYVRSFGGAGPSLVSQYVTDHSWAPWESYREVLTARPDDGLIETCQERLPDYDVKHALGAPHVDRHTLAPLLTKAALQSNCLDNGWGYAPLDGRRVAVRSPYSGEWHLLDPPRFEAAESVVGLDGAPTRELWQLLLGDEMQHYELLSRAEKRHHLRHRMGLELYQTTENWNAYQSGEGVAPTKDVPVIEYVCRREETAPVVISSKTGLGIYCDAGLDALTSRTGYYGNLKGTNRFTQAPVGFIAGNPHPGDEVIERWAAFAGQIATRSGRGAKTEYGEYGDAIHEAFVHKEVLQAILRFGRGQNTDRTAVYIHTAGYPSWLPVTELEIEVDSWIRNSRSIPRVIEAVKELEAWPDGSWSAQDIADEVPVTVRTVRDKLKRLAEYGYLSYERRGRGGALYFKNENLEEAPRFGEVEMSE